MSTRAHRPTPARPLAVPASSPIESAAVSRRTTLCAGLAGCTVLAGGVLAGCGGSGDEQGSGQAAETSPDGGGGEAGEIALADVPDGAGVILKDARAVVVRSGQEVRAFSAECTHQQCLVSEVDAEVITCFCHGSEFATSDGSVVKGPASEPLAKRRVTVDSQTVRVAAALAD